MILGLQSREDSHKDQRQGRDVRPCTVTPMSTLELPIRFLALQVYVPPSPRPRSSRISSRSERDVVEVIVTWGSRGLRGEPLWSQVMVEGGTAL